MEKFKKYFFLGVLVFLVGAAILWLSYREHSFKEEDNARASRPNTSATGAGSGNPASPNLQRDTAMPEPKVTSDDLGEITAPMEKAVQDEFAVQEEVLSRMTFYTRHNTGLLHWRRYSEVRREWEKELASEAAPSIESALQKGTKLIDEFWNQGDLSNPEGWKLIYKARFVAERALTADGGKDERLWTLLEDSIISAIPGDCPYSQQGGSKFNLQCFEMRQEGLDDIFEVSSRHCLHLITKKPLESVTPHDLAVANRVLRASTTRSIITLMLMDPEVSEMAGIDHEHLQKLSADAITREIESKYPKTLETLKRTVGEWMVTACESHGWENLKQEARLALDALEQGKQVPVVPWVYGQNILSKFPKDHDAFLRYDRFLDGFAMEYRGEPTHVPRI